MKAEKGARRLWTPYWRAKPSSRIRLWCFHHAGGAASFFRIWEQLLGPEVEVCAVQLPGREARLSEPPFTNVRELARAMTDVLAEFWVPPFAFFGHSLGALVAFEVARELRRRGRTGPVHFLASGRQSPSVASTHREIHALPDRELVELLREIGGTPEEVLADQEWLDLLLPTLRADFEMNEVYQYIEEAPLDCPISVLGGDEDPLVLTSELNGWRFHTNQSFESFVFPGTHFFLQESSAQIIPVVAQSIGRDR